MILSCFLHVRRLLMSSRVWRKFIEERKIKNREMKNYSPSAHTHTREREWRKKLNKRNVNDCRCRCHLCGVVCAGKGIRAIKWLNIYCRVLLQKREWIKVHEKIGVISTCKQRFLPWDFCENLNAARGGGREVKYLGINCRNLKSSLMWTEDKNVPFWFPT